MFLSGVRRLNITSCKTFDNFRALHVNCMLRNQEPIDNILGITIPPYKVNVSETGDVKKARLLYQSRKRGMLENDLLLSTFIDKHIFEMDTELLSQYDSLINSSYSDWDIYYWLVGACETPPEFDNKIMKLLKNHVRNDKREARFRQPNLPDRLFHK